MNKKTSSRLIACVAAVSLALSSMMATVWAADPAEAQFVARDGGETVSANDDGSVTVTTPDNSAGRTPRRGVYRGLDRRHNDGHYISRHYAAS